MVAKVSKSPLIVIVGPTASGKSGLAMKLAKKFKSEIICADSWTLRKKLDIGTAKPSDLDRRSVKQHLIDIIEPCEEYSAAKFKAEANKAIADIASRSKLPLLVGGSGLYIDGLIFNYSFRSQNSFDRNDLSNEQLLIKIRKLNLNTDDLDVHNPRRLIRLIETTGEKSRKDSLRSNTLIIGLNPSPEKLRYNIEKRVDSMLKDGLKREVYKLAEDYGWECEGLKGINYQEWREYYPNEPSYELIKEKLIRSNLRLSKKQITWFKTNKSIHWLNKTENYDEASRLLDKFLYQNFK